MTTAGQPAQPGPVGRADYGVVARHERFSGPVFDVVTDEVRMPGGGVAARDYVRHIGAVVVVALDDRERVVLVRQYRHPVGRRMWELPAGLVDVPGERGADVAVRELAEEADLLAGRVEPLIDLHTSPGYSTERCRVYLARELRPVPDGQRHERRDEEAELEVTRVPLAEAVRMVFAAEITNAAACAGILAVAHKSSR